MFHPCLLGFKSFGQIDSDEMTQVFNMGIGLTFIVNPFYAKTIADIASGHGAQELGHWQGSQRQRQESLAVDFRRQLERIAEWPPGSAVHLSEMPRH